MKYLINDQDKVVDQLERQLVRQLDMQGRTHWTGMFCLILYRNLREEMYWKLNNQLYWQLSDKIYYD
jgi:hypothetical protein